MYRGALANQLDTWKLLPRPERLTELYFTDHAHLPANYKADSPQTITFTVRNLEHQTTTYHYALAARIPGKEQLLAEGRLTLGDNASQDITRSIVVPALDSRVEIQARLAYNGIPWGHDKPSTQTQAIHYWVKAAEH